MSNKFFIYALFVTIVSTWSSWSKLLSAATRSSGTGSSWSSHGGGYYGGGGGGGHK